FRRNPLCHPRTLEARSRRLPAVARADHRGRSGGQGGIRTNIGIIFALKQDKKMRLSVLIRGKAMDPSAGWINDHVLIPDLLRAAPQARQVLDRYGLRGCGGPLGPVESLGFFAKAHDVPANRLLDEIRASIEQPAPPAQPEAAIPRDRLADALYRP